MDSGGNLYGTATYGGAFGDGTVFELAHGSGTLTTLSAFDGTNGSDPVGALIMDGSGNLYGTTAHGGASGAGTVFELANGSGTITTLASFSGTDGATPEAGLIMDSSGNLYGTTVGGGASGYGTVFELANGSAIITTLASFNGTNGYWPYAGLIMDGSGNLYGTTLGGTVFKLAAGSGAITTLASFNSTTGQDPFGGLVMDGSGNLYGTTEYGPSRPHSAGFGTVFELAHGSGTITTLASFLNSGSAHPEARLIMDSSGNLYGKAEGDGFSNSSTGTVFELVQGSNTITTLASFDGSNGASGPLNAPNAGLVMDASGNLYGTAYAGGASGVGTVFELAAGSSTITRLASFVNNGQNPYGGLVMDNHGNLYGTAPQGGAYGLGTVFEVAAGSGTITTLASLNGSDGANPYGTLVMDAGGNMYGTAYGGGASGDGTVFELAAGNSTITTLTSFNATDGANPYAGLIMDASGNLYGTTVYGGAEGTGTVFELAHGSGTITTLASCDYSHGRYPYGGLVMDNRGNLYGTTTSDGPPGADGTVFEVASGSRTMTTLASFNINGTDGFYPHGNLILDRKGNLYGTASVGGASGDGTVFELAKGRHTITALASFNGADGGAPYGALIMDGNDNLYGTASGGGASGDGTIFELARGSGTITTLAAFGGSNGAGPQGALIMDSSGNLYGTTAGGGAGFGTVFELPGVALPDQWTGANSAVDTNWSDGANWSLGVPPNPGQTVLFTNNASVKSFTSTVDTGFTSAIGVLGIDSTWGGTITVNSPLTVLGDFALASGSFDGSGAVTVGSSFSVSQWPGGQIDLGSGGFTTYGTLTADTTGGNLVLSGAGTLTNNGTIDEAGTNSLVLENSATLSNAAGATFDLTDNGSISQSGGGTFTNAGTLEKTGGTGTSTIATTTLDNTGTVAVSRGTLEISAAVSQVSGSTLTAGIWTVGGTATVHSKLDITSAVSFTTLGSGAQVMLNGPNTTFSNLKALRTINKGASFSLLGGQSFTTTGALTNKGSLILSPGSILTVSGSFTQTAAGSLIIELGGTDAAPTFGEVVSTSGTVALGGSLKVTSTVVSAVGSSFAVVDNEGNSAISGLFKGLAEGATFKVKKGAKTMTFQITYLAIDADGNQNIMITRIS
jgi:uncharacterized repeat protein (TIGR03803 family)